MQGVRSFQRDALSNFLAKVLEIRKAFTDVVVLGLIQFGPSPELALDIRRHPFVDVTFA